MNTLDDVLFYMSEKRITINEIDLKIFLVLLEIGGENEARIFLIQHINDYELNKLVKMYCLN